jgi:hypothetical protein
MKLIPATSSPAHPRRTRPIWIAISVEFGPGIKLVAPRKSRNSARVNHPRRVTASSSINAMCTAGPPKAVAPSLLNNKASSSSEVRRDSGAVFGCTSGVEFIVKY